MTGPRPMNRDVVITASGAAAPPRGGPPVACIGAGVIGGGWAAYFLARGFDVVAWDPAPDAEARLRAHRRRRLARPHRARPRPGRRPRPAARRRLARRGLRRRRLRPGERARGPRAQAPPARRPRLGDRGRRRRRLLDVIPLVEVVGGPETDPAVTHRAADFYREIGKSVIEMDAELPGFVANRLQEALWREALHMVARGEATVEQIDAAITEGPGLRWPVHGPCLTFHLAGGEGGMGHMLDHFGRR